MDRTIGEQKGWKRRLAIVIASAATLTALVALRGPDRIVSTNAEAVGVWLLSGPSVWHAQSLFGSLCAPVYALAGPRGWQNLHVALAWSAIVFWLLPLKPSAWRGMAPLIPALLAAVLSVPGSGLSAFGCAVAALSAWRWLTFSRPKAATFPVAAWLAAWLSPGALPLVAAFAAESSARWNRRSFAFAAAGAVAAVNLTPRGLSVWKQAADFLAWSPSAPPNTAGVAAILLNVVVLALALRWSIGKHCVGSVLAPIGLLLCATWGQADYLWVAALMNIPLWAPAKEQLQRLGVKVRWWAATVLLVSAIVLAAWSGWHRINDWYNLAMEREAVQPTLTRAALPGSGPVYINPRGLGLARFAAPLPARGNEDESLRLAREPRLWRAVDRKVRYRAVWLLGDKADYAPLARHLGESPDWRLAAVDAAGVLFLRGPRDGEFATEPAQQIGRSLLGAVNRSHFLAGCALGCLTAQAWPEAGEFSRAAVRKSDLSSDSAAARALVLISLGQIEEALEQSGRAVALTPASSNAWQARAETLLHAGRVDEAYAAAQRAAELSPGDEGALWLAARTANAARAFQAEAEILERLVTLTEGRGGDSGFYQLYLGQSYAKQGLARPALRALEKAAAAPGLTGEQRAELQEEVERVRQSSGRD